MAFNAQCSWHTITTKSSELLILILAVVSKTQTQANNFLATEIILLTKHKETDMTLICCLIEKNPRANPSSSCSCSCSSCTLNFSYLRCSFLLLVHTNVSATE